jgi:hypothetical protein
MASSVSADLALASLSMLVRSAASASRSCAASACTAALSPSLRSRRASPNRCSSALSRGRSASTSLGSPPAFARTASVIVPATLPARWSILAIATKARIAAAMTRIAVALISASTSCPGSRRSRAETRGATGSDIAASSWHAELTSPAQRSAPPIEPVVAGNSPAGNGDGACCLVVIKAEPQTPPSKARTTRPRTSWARLCRGR